MTFILTHTGVPIKKNNIKKYIIHTKKNHLYKKYPKLSVGENDRIPYPFSLIWKNNVNI